MNIFTNDDYRRIQAWLKANAIKDSDFAISENTVPDEDILVITQNMSIVPTNYKIKIKDLLNSSLGKIVIDKITANVVKVNNTLTVDASKVILNNEKGTTLQNVFDYFEEGKLNRHTDDTFDGNLTIKKDITIEGNIKSDEGLTTVEENLKATGEIIDGHGNQLNDVNSAAKNWRIEYQDPSQDEPTVRAKYVLKDYKGVPKGNVIKVYKDSAITNVYLGTTEDTCNPDTGEVTKKPIHDNNEALSIVYRLDTGKYMLVNVPIGIFTREVEFDKYRGLGIEPNGQVFVKLASDVESTNYLHFNSLGEIAADGIEARILRDLGTLIDSIAGDGTMWGTYKEHEGTQETSTPNDGSRWGEFKRAEEIREQTSDSAHTVFSDNWDAQDDDPKLPQDRNVVEEASYAYNWKSVNGSRKGNIEDIVDNVTKHGEKLDKLDEKVGIFKYLDIPPTYYSNYIAFILENETNFENVNFRIDSTNNDIKQIRFVKKNWEVSKIISYIPGKNIYELNDVTALRIYVDFNIDITEEVVVNLDIQNVESIDNRLLKEEIKTKDLNVDLQNTKRKVGTRELLGIGTFLSSSKTVIFNLNKSFTDDSEQYFEILTAKSDLYELRLLHDWDIVQQFFNLNGSGFYKVNVKGSTNIPINRIILNCKTEGNNESVEVHTIECNSLLGQSVYVNLNFLEIQAIKSNFESIHLDKLGKVSIEELDTQSLPKVCSYDMLLFGKGKPTITPDIVSQMYLDCETDTMYIAVGNVIDQRLNGEAPKLYFKQITK